MKSNTHIALLLIGILVMAAGCSTTSRLSEGEILYNGQSLDLKKPDGVIMPAELSAEITDAVNVRPNNP